MIDINKIRENPEKVKQLLLKRMDNVDFAPILELDEKKRSLQTLNDNLKAEKNKVSSQVAILKKQGQDATEIIEKTKQLGMQIDKNNKELDSLQEQYFYLMSALPNIPDEDLLPGGKENNKVIKTYLEKPEFTPVNHYDTAVNLDIIDYKRSAKISGAGTCVYKGAGAMLEWALLNYFIDFHTANGYTFILPPHILNYQSGFSAGQFPKFENDVFWTDFSDQRKESKFLLPTAETALLNMHRDEILTDKEMPIKYFGYTPCYRREAGSYRTDERGMIRGYQFNKVEMLAFCKPDQSEQIFEEFVANAEKLVEGLGLHFRTVKLAAGDCSASMARTYDIEVYIPSMNGYKEVSSASNAKDYQARRASIKYRNQQGKTEYTHTLNASGLATSRLLPAILEQCQNEDGSVNVPEVLQKYMHGITKIEKK